MTRPPATLLRGGTVHSPADPFATAMLVVHDRVAWVGSDAAADLHADGVDEVVDLDGALVTPAFVDAHVHLTEAGLLAEAVDLRAARSLRECLDLVANWARAHPGEDVIGHGWDEGRWPEGRPPSPGELDRAVGGRLAYLSRVDAHSAVASSALVALVRTDLAHNRAQVRPEPAHPAPPEHAGGALDGTALDGGALDGGALDGTGQAGSDHGRADVRRNEHALVGAAHIAARLQVRRGLSVARRGSLQAAALQSAAAKGVAAVHEMAGPELSGESDVQALREAVAQRGDLPDVAIYWAEWGREGARHAAALGAAGAAGDLCIDGSLGSRSALLDEPYADAPSRRGVAHLDEQQALEHVLAATKAGMQAGFHCIGDAAVRRAVSALSAAADLLGTAVVVAARHRLEHVEMVDPSSIAALARLGVVASVQPGFDSEWGGPGGMYQARLGTERARALNPFAAMARAGVTLAFGSDAPVTEVFGWAAVRAAAHHHQAEHRLSVRAAFTAHTRGGWRAARRDDAGVLAPGMLASYAVWDVPADELVVQAPDERRAAWSTDPRAGVPGLPALVPGSVLPRCVRTVASGRVVFDAF